ncbi:unnamed protein product [Strongylus vulgaris]|uniref:SGNH domain-containing protein n=1 Tax=Strongylus vulgaris TaxID=40348 RepID=A0A3P7J6J6_STRVU|nr:unnamed protein product [Strongylus vulgaris]
MFIVVYLLQALPSCIPDCVGTALAFTESGRPLRDIGDKLIIEDDFFARERIYEVEKRCRKCEIIDYFAVLADKEGHYLGYNPENNLMYLDREHHFNRFAKQRLQILYNRLAQEFESSKLFDHHEF